MRRVIIESPYAGNHIYSVEQNVEYAKQCMRDCITRGEAPFASHLLYTQVLDDNNNKERGLGIKCGFAWSDKFTKHVFYLDRGMSNGMNLALDRCLKENILYEFRYLYTPDYLRESPYVDKHSGE